MKSVMSAFVVMAGSTVAWAQGGQIDILSAYGPSGTRLNLELPVDSFTYQSTVTCNYSFHYDLKVYKNGVLKLTDSFDVINPGGSYSYSKAV